MIVVQNRDGKYARVLRRSKNEDKELYVTECNNVVRLFDIAIMIKSTHHRENVTVADIDGRERHRVTPKLNMVEL